MTYERLEQAPAWQRAVELAALVYNLTDTAKEVFTTKTTLKNQIEHAALSIVNEIAKGYGRSSNDLFHSLQKSYCSINELRSMVGLMERIDALAPFKTQLLSIRESCDSCSREVMDWARNLNHVPANGHSSIDPALEEERRRQAREKRAVFEGLRQLNGM